MNRDVNVPLVKTQDGKEFDPKHKSSIVGSVASGADLDAEQKLLISTEESPTSVDLACPSSPTSPRELGLSRRCAARVLICHAEASPTLVLQAAAKFRCRNAEL
ncbi:hypothetical protein RRG08_012479 [Elysia crispata]|nr:hypothetical protein RRG08_012479 [Elysia crispata]